MDNIQNMFFEKNNLKKMNDTILQKMNLTNSTPEQKRYIVEMLIKNMKLVWQKIDSTKINQSNFNTIFSQFNSYSFNSTIKELQEKIKPQNPEPSTLKFERDFLSTPQNPVQVPQRAQPSKQTANYNTSQGTNYNTSQGTNYNTSQSTNNNNYNTSQSTNNNNYNTVQGANSYYMDEAKRTHQLASQFEPEIDSLFRPLAPTIPDEPSFNNYNFNKGNSKDVKKKLDDVRVLRDNETYISKKPSGSDIPDFLKPKSTSCRTDDDDNYQQNNQSNYSNNQQNNQSNYSNNQQTNQSTYSNNQPSKKSNNDNDFLLGVDNDSGDLMSINNYDIGITDETKYEEDKDSFTDRLSKLKNDRESVQIPKSKGKVQFDDESFNDIKPTNINDLKKKNTKKYST